jgi:hypothetical protein
VDLWNSTSPFKALSLPEAYLFDAISYRFREPLAAD